MVNVTLLRGRLGKKTYEAFASAGYDCPTILEKNRGLTSEDRERRVRYFWVKPSGVSIYVERGAADVGATGRDILLEYEPDAYELLDPGIGRCRMCVAGSGDFYGAPSQTLRVATKFPRITAEHYAVKSRNIDIIKLNGSIELAPILDLSGAIMDIAETGKTLLENHLAPLEIIVDVSVWLISSQVNYQFKYQEIAAMQATLTRKL